MAHDEKRLLVRAAHLGAEYKHDLESRAVVPSAAALEALERFEEPLPQQGAPAGETLEMLHELGSAAAMPTTGGRYYGFVNGGALPEAAAAHVLATAWDQNAALEVMSPIANRLHSVASRWMVELLGLPESSRALFVGSATVANLCAVVAGRDHLLQKMGHNVAEEGLRGSPELHVVAGASTHSTTAKALSASGLGRNNVRSVEVDDQGRLLARALPDLDGPVLLLAQAGEVNTGAFDPFDAIADWAALRLEQDRGPTWLHVDGAFGLWAAVSPNHSHLLAGVDRFDSWATDGHKWPNLPYDSGILLVRDPAALRRSFSISAAYLPEGEVLEPMHYTPQSSQRARGVDAWAAIRSLGRSGLADLVERTCGFAESFARGLEKAGFEVLNEVEINQVLVSFGSDERTAEVIQRIQAAGVCWCGPTIYRGRTAMRISVSSWATTAEDVERSLESMIEAAT